MITLFVEERKCCKSHNFYVTNKSMFASFEVLILVRELRNWKENARRISPYHVEYTLTPVPIRNVLRAHNLPSYDELFVELRWSGVFFFFYFIWLPSQFSKVNVVVKHTVYVHFMRWICVWPLCHKIWWKEYLPKFWIYFLLHRTVSVGPILRGFMSSETGSGASPTRQTQVPC